MANTKVTGDLIASGTITADNLVSGTLDTILNSYLTTNTYATQGYVTTAVNNLIAAAPSSLDTLNELAAALNDDANFATTVTNSLATKLNLSGGTMTGALITISPLTIQDSTPYIQWKNASGTRLGYIQHNETDLVMSADTGDIGLDANTNVFGNIKSEANEGKLILNSTAANGKQYEFISIDTGNFGLYDGTAYRLWISGNGNVGIGTTSPAEKLHINGNIRLFSGGYPYIDIGVATNNYFRLINDNPNDTFLLQKNGSTLVTFTAGGNLGIGTTSPSHGLHVYHPTTNVQATFESGDTTVWINLKDNTSGTYGALLGAEGGDFIIAPNNNRAAVFKGNGNVGIGTTSPGQALTIQTDSSVYNNLELKDSRSKASTPEASIAFRGRYSGAAENTMGLIISKYDNAVDANSSSNMQFYINNGYSVVQSMKLQNDSSLAIANGTQGSNAISSQIIFGNRGYFSNPAVGGAKIVGVSGSPNWYSGTSLAFYTNPGSDVTATAPVERVRILASGGITFNGDTAAANALDDYEEGTWTPSFYFDFAPPSISYVNQEGYYQKIGNTVTVWFDLYATGMNSTSYYWARLGGLPFAPASNNQYIKAPLHHSGNSTFSIGLRGGTNPVMYANLNRTGFARGNDVDSSYISGHFSYIIA